METLDKIYQFSVQKNREGIVVDTVLLLLLLIGRYDLEEIKNFEPTHQYSKEDYKLLNKIIRPFKKIFVTPQILAELSNHSLNSLYEDKLHHYLCVVVDFLRDKNNMEEVHLAFDDWEEKNIKKLCSFGFVDMGMYEISKQRGIPIVTDDFKFYNFSKSSVPMIKLSVVKNSHIRI